MSPEDAAPEEIMQAHQYLYYVKSEPIISDYEYDMFCKEHGLFGGGGSDLWDSYSERVRSLAEEMYRRSRLPRAKP